MNKGMIGYAAVFVLLIVASLITVNTEEITPTMVQAQGSLSMGGTFTTLEEIVSLLFKAALGTIVTSALTVAVVQGWKHYKHLERGERSRRWNPGPNARWQQGGSGSRSTPNLRREDLMLLALMNGRMPSNNMIQPRFRSSREPAQDESIELDF